MVPTPESIKLGNCIKLLRKSKKQKEYIIAMLLGMSEGNYSKYEAGILAFKYSHVETIMKALGISMVDFVMKLHGRDILDKAIEPLSKVLLEFFINLIEEGTDVGHNKEEIQKIIALIIEDYNRKSDEVANAALKTKT
jgi:transcriptional regulator with XRE-family HTH domain